MEAGSRGAAETTHNLSQSNGQMLLLSVSPVSQTFENLTAEQTAACHQDLIDYGDAFVANPNGVDIIDNCP